MQGYIIELFKQNKYQNLTFDYLKEKITTINQYLKRKRNNNKPDTQVDKSILGALHSTGLFNKIDKNVWGIK